MSGTDKSENWQSRSGRRRPPRPCPPVASSASASLFALASSGFASPNSRPAGRWLTTPSGAGAGSRRPTPDGGEAGGARADGGAGPRAGGAAASSWACAASSSPSSSAPAGPWRHGGGPRGARRRRPSRGERGPASALRASGRASGGEQAAGGA